MNREDADCNSKFLEVADDGRLFTPPDIARRYGMAPGTHVPVEDVGEQLIVRSPVTHLAKVHLFSGVDLPRMDDGGLWNPDVMDLILRYGLSLDSESASTRSFDACPFVQKGSTSVRWDGMVRPCLPLLHTHTARLGTRKRLIHEHTFGSIVDRGLREVWERPRYLSLRKRLQEFSFLPAFAATAVTGSTAIRKIA